MKSNSSSSGVWGPVSLDSVDWDDDSSSIGALAFPFPFPLALRGSESLSSLLSSSSNSVSKTISRACSAAILFSDHLHVDR